MQAIILAAGMGRRLGEFTANNTKCMLEVNGVRLIDRMLGQLLALDLSRIIIVVGYEGQNLIDYITSRYHNDKIVFILLSFFYAFLKGVHLKNIPFICFFKDSFVYLIVE